MEAKEALPHGAFAAMIDSDLPFKARTAQRLMVTASDERLANPTHVSHLPPHWGTLYELTKLPDDVFQTKLADGTIHPEMQRKDVAQERGRSDSKREGQKSFRMRTTLSLLPPTLAWNGRTFTKPGRSAMRKSGT